MRRYIEQLHAKEPHQKREFAAHAAAALTGVIFLVWISTLGARLASGGVAPTLAGTDASSLVAATAQAGAAFQNQIQSFGTSAQGGDSQPATVQSADQSAGGSGQGLYSTSTTDTSNTDSGGATVIGTPDNPATILSN